jgi:hypothetical protein
MQQHPGEIPDTREKFQPGESELEGQWCARFTVDVELADGASVRRIALFYPPLVGWSPTLPPYPPKPARPWCAIAAGSRRSFINSMESRTRTRLRKVWPRRFSLLHHAPDSPTLECRTELVPALRNWLGLAAASGPRQHAAALPSYWQIAFSLTGSPIAWNSPEEAPHIWRPDRQILVGMPTIPSFNR